jgi:Ca2+-binding EF-hand superfamily protein
MSALQHAKTESYKQIDDIEFKTLDINPILKTRIIQEAFMLFDINGNGVIEHNEVKVLLKSLQEDVDDKKIAEFIKSIDKDLNQEVSLEEFTDMMMKFEFNNVMAMNRHVASIFDSYDKDEDGFISIKDIEDAGKDLETDLLTPDEMELLIKFSKNMASKKGIEGNSSNKLISKEEFTNFLLNVEFLYEVPDEDIYVMPKAKQSKLQSNSNIFSVSDKSFSASNIEN